MFSHMCNPIGWPLRRHKRRDDRSDDDSGGEDTDEATATRKDDDEDVSEYPTLPSSVKLKPLSSSANGTLDVFRATDDLDLVGGACRCVDYRHLKINSTNGNDLLVTSGGVEDVCALPRAVKDEQAVKLNLAKVVRTKALVKSVSCESSTSATTVTTTTTTPPPVAGKVSLTWAIRESPRSSTSTAEETQTKDETTDRLSAPPTETLRNTLQALVGGRRRTPPPPPPAPPPKQQIGYEVGDLATFLSGASMSHPGNIPMVTAFQCELNRGAGRRGVSLQLGMVVNAIYRQGDWLYVRTPHGDEGFVTHKACMPLTASAAPSPSTANPWDLTAPSPSTNKTDNEKLDETTRRSLAVVTSTYRGKGRNSLSVTRGERVTLLNHNLKDWLWVRNARGQQGFVPAAVIRHNIL